MAIAVRCSKCGNELTQPGGLTFSPPLDIKSWLVEKKHLCKGCWDEFELWLKGAEPRGALRELRKLKIHGKDNPMVSLTMQFEDGVQLRQKFAPPVPQAVAMAAVGRLLAECDAELDFDLPALGLREGRGQRSRENPFP